MTISTQAGLPVSSNILGGFRSRRQVAVFPKPLFSGGVLVGLFLSLTYLLKEAPIFLEGLIHDCEKFTRKSSP